MDLTEFHSFLSDIVTRLHDKATADITFITSCHSGDDFELRVVTVINELKQEQGLVLTIHHTPGGHAFPDIVLEDASGHKYGVEVKSSSSTSRNNWKINGNSVLGSTRDDDVIETYILFGKLAPAVMDFRFKKYELCVSNVAVTHSPRYMIDLNISEDETFFAKSGISYEAIKNSGQPISLITDYYRREGLQAWWLTDASPAALRLFSELSEQEQEELFAYGMACFPELFARNNKKYKRFALWLATERSVIAPCLRDDFSAGGRVELNLRGHTYTAIPQIFGRLKQYRTIIKHTIEEAEIEDLRKYWGVDEIGETLQERLHQWIDLVSTQAVAQQLPEDTSARTIISLIMEY